MARFFFTQEQNIEMIVRGGKPSGGAVINTMVWMRALYELGHDVILARYENDDRHILKEYLWVQTYKIYDPNKGIPKIRWLSYRLGKFFIALKKSNCDYVFESIPSWYSFFLGLMCRILSKKLIIRVANDNMLDKRIKMTHSSFERIFIFFGFRIASFILVQNKFQFNSLKVRFPNKNILKVFNPYILEKSVGKIKIEKRKYIGWAANFRYQKNPELFYRIAIKLPNELFKVAGKPISTMDSETGEFIEKLKKLPNVEFVGVVDRQNILSFFSKCKFLLNTSRYEGFSNTFLEAMSTGTPILTTNNVNPDGIIDRFDLGLIYENETDLGLKLDSMSEINYLEKSKNCLEYVQNYHNYLVLGKKFLNFLEENENNLSSG